MHREISGRRDVIKKREADTKVKKTRDKVPDPESVSYKETRLRQSEDAGSLLYPSRRPFSGLLLLVQAGIVRLGVDNAPGNNRKYGADVLDRVVRHGEVVVAQHNQVGVLADF
jgi:hypothetical protein